ncbi:MAG: TVP38/TMEM64 family protein [Burkholderiaceae bacterium]
MRLIVTAGVVALLAGLALAWSISPLKHAFDIHALVAMGHTLRASPLAPLALMGVYVIAGLIAMPLTLLIGATVIAFGAWPGALYAFVGSLINGTLIYAIGRFAGRDLVTEWLARRGGSKIETLNRQLERRGLIAMALIRLVPISYSLVNLIAGASKIRFVDFAAGTALGLVPVIGLIAGLAAEFDQWLEHPSWRHLFALLCAAIVVFATIWLIRQLIARRNLGR